MDIDPKSAVHVYFDSRISEDSLAPHKAFLEAVLKGDVTHGANVEKLRNYNIYSVRTSIKSRILFTFQKINGQNSLLVLEVLENHEYDKSKFLKKNVLKKYLEKNQSDLTTGVRDTEFEPASVIGKTENPKGKITFKSALESNRGHIMLDEAQICALSSKTPMIIEGPPGSGKTSLAEGFVKQALSQHQTVLMVTRSALLASKINQSLSQCPEYDATKVRVVAYKDLFLGLREDGKSVFESWYALLKQPFKPSDVYEECRILSGCDLNDYTSPEGIGLKQCRFSDPKQRAQLAVLYKLWLAYLKKENIKLSDFYRPTEKERLNYDLVILDEAQDFSHLQLRNLAEIPTANNLIVCVDRRQNIEDENPKIIYLKKMITGLYQTIPNIIQLTTHYRCPQRIMAFAKVFNDLRLHFSPKLKAEPKIADSAHHEGALHWIETNDKAQLAQIQEMKDNADTCVITQEKFKEEAKKILGITQVFTAEEIKGLEYKTVILYKILDNEKIYQINSLLSPKNKALLPEAQNSSAELSACFVAATRPTETLYFIHDAKQHNLSAIIQKLKETVTTLDPSQPLKAPESTHTSTADEWAARAKEAVERNKLEDARTILKQHVKMSDNTAIEKRIAQWQTELNIKSEHTEVKKSENKHPSPTSNPIALKPRAISSKEAKDWFDAIEAGNLVKVNSLLSKNKRLVDLKSEFGFSGLTYAADFGHLEIVQALLSAGADCNLIDTDEGVTALTVAADKGHLETVQTLLFAGAKCNIQSKVGTTALMQATFQGHLKIVQKLISAGADCNLVDKQGLTAINIAADPGHLEIVQNLLSAGGNCNLMDKDGITPLMRAAEKGHLEIVQTLLSARVNCNAMDNEGFTPIMRAAEQGHVAIVQTLLSAQADCNLKSKEGSTALIIAAACGHLEIVQILLSAGADCYYINKAALTALMVAAAGGFLDIVKLLLGAGANPNFRNNKNETAVSLAGKFGHKDIVKFILDFKPKQKDQRLDHAPTTHLLTQFEGMSVTETISPSNRMALTAAPVLSKESKEWFDAIKEVNLVKVNSLLSKNKRLVDLKSESGFTGIMLAANSGNFEMLQTLLSAGAKCNLQSKKGLTALMQATIKEHLKIVQKLISVGADCNLQTIHGKTPLMLASFNGHLDLVKTLLSARADCNLKDKEGFTALMLATFKGHLDTVETLLSAGADCNLRDKDWVSALMRAADNGHLKIVKRLLLSGADCNLRDKNNGTALIFASFKGHLDIVQSLLSAGADCNLTNKDDLTPLMAAASAGFHDIVKLLLEAGANPNLRNNEKETAVSLAAKFGHKVIVKCILDFKTRPKDLTSDSISTTHLLTQFERMSVTETKIDSSLSMVCTYLNKP